MEFNKNSHTLCYYVQEDRENCQVNWNKVVEILHNKSTDQHNQIHIGFGKIL